MDINEELRKLPVEGYIWLNIRSTNTSTNVETHKAFKSFAKIETDDNYTQAIKKLLEYWDLFHNQSQIPELLGKIHLLEERVEQLEQKVESQRKEDKDEGVF
jgi:hypothetical protein